MAFFSRALKKAEVFLEQVDDRVAEASRRIALESAASSASAIPDSSHHPPSVGAGSPKKSLANPPDLRSLSATSSVSKRPRAPIIRPQLSVATEGYAASLDRDIEQLHDKLLAVDEACEETNLERAALARNLKQAKKILEDLEESLKHRTSECRDLRDALDRERDRLEAAERRATDEATATKTKLETMRKEAALKETQLRAECEEAAAEVVRVTEENASVRERLRLDRENDMSSADVARSEAARARADLEEEVAHHNETRHTATIREEALETSAAEAATALAKAERKVETERLEAAAAVEKARAVEGMLQSRVTARDEARAKISAFEEELAETERRRKEEYGKGVVDKLLKRTEDLAIAIEKREMEIARLEGEAAGLREAARRSSLGQRDRGNYTALEEVQNRLREMADATAQKETELESLRGENKTLLHQLKAERKSSREAQSIAAARAGPRAGWEDMERGESGNSSIAALWRSGDGATLKFRRRSNWPDYVNRATAAIDRVSIVALAVLRKEALLRMAFLGYLVVVHLFVYVLLNYEEAAVSSGDGGESVHAPPGMAGRIV